MGGAGWVPAEGGGLLYHAQGESRGVRGKTFITSSYLELHFVKCN